MAKNKVEIDVKVDDKGTTKKVGLGAKKASKNLDKLGTSASTADRNMKGAAQASANGTKNFSKMAQGMGGLVGAYATLAANIFAISAAYNFLKSAGDMRILEQGQKAYAMGSGIAIRSLTNDIIAATDAQIGFKEASQAAAIGLSSGLNVDQLKRLGKAAKDTSAILGRDVTDSFNRLVKGATKAEPELLDELGIILRLEPATKKYADAIGKTAKDLTAFERTQAVTNEILSQSEEKYSSMLEQLNPMGNAVAKLGKAFENDLLKPLQKVIALVVEPVFAFLADNVIALAAAMAALGLPIIRAIIPGLTGMTTASKEASKAAWDTYKTQKIASEKFRADKKLELAALKSTGNAARQNASSMVTGIQARKGSGIAKLQAGEEPSARSRKAMIRAAEDYSKQYHGLKKKDRKMFVEQLKLMDAANTRSTGFFTMQWAKASTFFQTTVKRMGVAWMGFVGVVKSGALLMVKGINFALKGLFLVGILVMVWDLAKGAYNMIANLFRSPEDRSMLAALEAKRQKLEDLTSAATTLNAELALINKADLAKDTKIGKMTGAERVSRAGNTAANIDVSNLKTLYNEGDEDQRQKAIEQMKLLKKNFEDVGDSSNLSKVFKEMTIDATMSEAALNSFTANLVKMQAQGVAATAFTKNLKDLPASLSKLTKSYLPSTKFDDSINIIKATIKAIKEANKDDMYLFLDTKESKEYGKQLKTLKVLETLRDQKIKDQSRMLTNELALNKALLSAGPVEARSAQLLKKNADAQASISSKSEEISNFNAVILENGAKISAFEKLTLDRMNLQLDNLKAKKLLTDQEIVRNDRLAVLRKEATLSNKESLGIELKYSKLLRNRSKLQTVSIKRSQDLEKALKAVADQEQKIRDFMIDQNGQAKRLNSEDELTIANMRIQKDLLLEQQQLREDALNNTLQLKNALRDGFEGATVTNIADLIKGNESSIKDAMMKIAKGALEAVADKLAEQLTLNVTDFIFGKDPAIVAQQANTTALTSLTAAITSKLPAGAAGAGVAATIAAPKVVGEVAAGVTETGAEMAEVITTGSKKAVIPFVTAFGDFFANFKTGELSFGESLKGLFTDIGVDFKGIFDGFGDMFGSMFKGLFGGDGGGGIMSSIFTGISSMFGAPAARNGGVFSAGQKVPGYATGGIARGSTSGYPATLHGTEAVVPLPHGGKIPVEMKGAGSQQNNVVVNISNEGQAQTQSSSGMDADKLGQAVAAAVQVEMQNQKRSGGILNPYGVA
tara:strand:+ start:584 stop:4321 length:3738 start_codon:yes stop_codon:yes gene_type:complete